MIICNYLWCWKKCVWCNLFLFVLAGTLWSDYSWTSVCLSIAMCPCCVSTSKLKFLLFKLYLSSSFISEVTAINIYLNISVTKAFHQLIHILPKPFPPPRLHDFKAEGAVNVNCCCYYSFRKQSGRTRLCHTAISLKTHMVSWGKPGEELHLEQSRMSHLLYTLKGRHRLKSICDVCIFLTSIQKPLVPEPKFLCVW